MIAAVLITAGLAGAAAAQPFPDPDGDATVSRADEQTKAGERFDALDANKDGVVSEDEMAAAAKAQGSGQGQRGPGGGMRRADADGDGKVTKAEYLAAQLERFDQQDADKNGQVTKAERDAARAERMKNWGGPPPGQ
ncbi:MAG: EF-hand domain-containing protein [Novosphingobium sp.]